MGTHDTRKAEIRVEYEQGELCWLDAILALQDDCALPPSEAEALVGTWEEGLNP